MTSPDSTCWTVINGAARGERQHQDDFSRRYAPIVRAYVEARWRRSALCSEADDAVQEVFLECFRAGGVLERVTEERPRTFRAFLYGVTQNVALRFEARAERKRELPAGSAVDLDAIERSEETLSQIFDRAWARALLKEALKLQRTESQSNGERAERRVELLRLRFEKGMPIRDIAAEWKEDPALVHREYLLARKEFRAALVAVLKFHHPASDAEVEQELGLMRGLLA